MTVIVFEVTGPMKPRLQWKFAAVVSAQLAVPGDTLEETNCTFAGIESSICTFGTPAGPLFVTLIV